jgi:hypothetical protein
MREARPDLTAAPHAARCPTKAQAQPRRAKTMGEDIGEGENPGTALHARLAKFHFRACGAGSLMRRRRRGVESAGGRDGRGAAVTHYRPAAAALGARRSRHRLRGRDCRRPGYARAEEHMRGLREGIDACACEHIRLASITSRTAMGRRAP